MPAKKKTQKNGNAGKVQQRKKNNRANGGTQQSVMSAPAAVSSHGRQFVRFLATTQGSKRMLVKCALAEIANGSTVGAFLFAAATECVSAQLSPTLVRRKTFVGTTMVADDMISPVLDLEGSAYTRYRVNSLKFEYDPQSATSSDGRYIFAYAADPAHPIIASVTTNTPTTAGLESLTDVMPFGAWEPWVLDVSASVSKFRQEWLYTSPQDASATAVSADDRLGFFGSCACLSPGAGTGQKGLLYMIIDIEFAEFCPITTTRPALHVLARRSEVDLVSELLERYDFSLKELFAGLLRLSKDNRIDESCRSVCLGLLEPALKALRELPPSAAPRDPPKVVPPTVPRSGGTLEELLENIASLHAQVLSLDQPATALCGMQDSRPGRDVCSYVEPKRV